MEKKRIVSLLRELIRSEHTTVEQKIALDQAIDAIRRDQLVEALKILAPLAGMYIKMHSGI